MQKILLLVMAMVFMGFINANARSLVVSWEMCEDCIGYKLELENRYDDTNTSKIYRFFGLQEKQTVEIGVENRYIFKDVSKGKWRITIRAKNGSIYSSPAIEEIVVK